MFKQQFKLAWRNLRKNHQFAFLNLIGLSTGLACALSIYLWVSDELNVNRFGASSDRVYQVMQSLPEGNGAIQNTPGLLASALPAEMPALLFPQPGFPTKVCFRLATRTSVPVAGSSARIFLPFSLCILPKERQHNCSLRKTMFLFLRNWH
jgi:hypothetical protein